MKRITDNTYTTDMNDFGWLVTFEFEMNKGRVDIIKAAILQDQTDVSLDVPLSMFTRSDLTDIELEIEVELECRAQENRPRRFSNVDPVSGLRITGEL